jgi:hypothetical protein
VIKPKTALGTRHHNPTEVADDGEGLPFGTHIPDNDGELDRSSAPLPLLGLVALILLSPELCTLVRHALAGVSPFLFCHVGRGVPVLHACVEILEIEFLELG